MGQSHFTLPFAAKHMRLLTRNGVGVIIAPVTSS